jgi:hypothetical protein
VEVVKAGLTAAEAVAASVPADFSSRTSYFSSSESLRIMILPSPSGLTVEFSIKPLGELEVMRSINGKIFLIRR